MVLIVSQNEDNSTADVIKWLIHYDIKFVRVNRGDSLTLQKISINNDTDCELILLSNKRQINLAEVSSIWYRRGEICFQVPNLSFIENIEFRKRVDRYLRDENKILENYIQYLINSIPHIGTQELRGVNKLVVLNEAKKLGIQIPETLIVSERKKLIASEKIITKAISEVFDPIIEDKKFITYTEVISKTSLSAAFFPSLFQNLIEKEADIRVFILQNTVYSMAIRSQAHPQTKVDFRKYLSKNPSRSFPFKLPEMIEQKLLDLMRAIHLETASIDMIFTKDGKFIFLEANPIGQFGMTSVPCNYFIEREIARSLINISINK